RNIENNIVGKDIETTKEISAVLPIENEDEEEQDQENDGLPDEQTNSNSDDSNQDINEENNGTIEIEEPRITRTGRKVHKPKHFDDYKIYAAYDVQESENDPQTYEEAHKSEEWQKAIQSELISHDKLKTWSITDLPDGKSPIDTRWVFRTKEDGTKKARLVAKDFNSGRRTINNNVCPSDKNVNCQNIAIHALQQNWDLRQLDIPMPFKGES
ncbi:Retrovirus-related Pol polyprotein from transposon TNT 1-94, partial [Gonioctena quinquepunctata]